MWIRRGDGGGGTILLLNRRGVGEREPLCEGTGSNKKEGREGVEDVLSPQVMSAPRLTQSLRKGFFLGVKKVY
jgi:hypothetical protein